VGTGTLNDFCAQYNLSSKRIIRKLQGQGVMASADLTLKEIASQSHESTIDLFRIIKTIVKA